MQISFGGMLASQVELAGTTAATGMTPSALPAGVHDVTVIGQDGQQSTINAAFTVEATESGESGSQPKTGCSVVENREASSWVVVLLGLLGLRRRKD